MKLPGNRHVSICITGGIACGKSAVGEELKESGVPVIDADAVCHEMMVKGGLLFDRIISVFGRGVLDRYGEIDRRVLGRIVFADEEKRSALNAIVHPVARVAITAWLQMQKIGVRETAPRRRNNMAAAIVPLVYEAGWGSEWDAVVCVAAPESLQVSRLRKKGFSGSEARARIAAQMPLAEKMRRADYVIFNSGTFAGLRQQTALVFRNIKEQAEKYHGRKK